MRVGILLFLLLASNGFAQEWQRHHRNDLGLSYSLTSRDYTGRHFRINPYDNSLWMTTQSTAQTISTDGTTKFFRFNNTPVLAASSYRLMSFEFLPGKVFILSEYGNIYLYENETFSSMYTASGLFNGLATDGDTLYILRDNNPLVKWTNENLYYLFNSGNARVMIVKNNLFWASEGFYNVGSVTLYSEDGNYTSYHPSSSAIMDHGNYDFKFSPNSDTLYVSGNKGLSLLHNQVFFDSIAPDNTTNMPPGIIIEFEFDADDNIWALFGSNPETPTSIAHYDQASKTWDAYYDATNSDLNFDTYCSIEMDTEGNLWMVNQHYIHVLGLGTLPGWVSVKQTSFKQTVSVYPNPATEKFYIETDAVISELYLTDQLGKRIRTLDPKENEFSVEQLSTGMYFVEIINEANEKSTVKLMKY